jgi:hypothetical protein
MIVQDGGLLSKVGGGANCCHILRIVFAILKKNDRWDKLGKVEGLLQLLDQHKKDLSELYGKFEDYKSFDAIITSQYNRWKSTNTEQRRN